MTSVTGYTAERMKAIEDASVVNGSVDGEGHLLLTRFDGTEFDAGIVRDPPSLVVCTEATKPATGLYNGIEAYETDTKKRTFWDGDGWRPITPAPGWSASRTTTAGIGDGNWLKIPFNEADTWDTDGYHSLATNNERFTIPRAGLDGRYEVKIIAEFEPNATGSRGIKVSKNGADNPNQTMLPVNATTHRMMLTLEDILAVNDYWEVWLWQNSGGTLNTSRVTCQGKYIGPV